MTPKEQALFQLDASEVRAGQRWKHTKTGSIYTIVATGLAEATLAPVVIYAGHDGVVWVRALNVFLGDNDEKKPRFLLVDAVDDIEIHTAPFAKLDEPARRCCLASGFPPHDHSIDCSLGLRQGARA